MKFEEVHKDMKQVAFMALARSPRLAAECTRRTLKGITSGCKGCGACCGRILPMTKREQQVLKKYVKDNGVKPQENQFLYCALLDMESGLCTAYDARPTICRIWSSPNDAKVVATRPGQPCGANISKIHEFNRIYPDIEQVDTFELFGLE